MISTMITPSEARADLARADRETLLADPEWVDAEFLAIMRASGLDDSVAIGVAPRGAAPLQDGPGGEVAAHTYTRQERDTSALTRVRSPPTHP